MPQSLSSPSSAAVTPPSVLAPGSTQIRVPGLGHEGRLTHLGSAQACGNPQCSAPDRAARLSFEGQPVCGTACAEALLRGAIAREHALNTAAALEQRPRVQIGRILVEQGTITEAALEQALRSQKATGAGRLGCWLKQQTDLPEEAFTAALAIQCHCPVFRLNNFAASRMAHYLPKFLVENLAAVPLRLTGEPAHLSICFEDRVDHELVRALERMHGMPVDAGLVLNSDFWQANADLAVVAFPRARVVSAPDLDSMVGAMAQTVERLAVSDARLVSMHGYYWLRLWQQGAVERDIICSVSVHAPAFVDGQLAEEMGSL
jgi:hypothetical protein